MSMPMETITSKIQDSGFRIQDSTDENRILAENGFFWRENGGVKVLVCRSLEENGFVNGFSTRLGGVSAFPKNDLNLAGFGEDSEENISENRRRFLNVFGDDYRLTTVWQVHGDAVKIVKNDEDIENTEERCDALASNLQRILIGVKTADCVPVLLGEAKTGAFAAIHAGWRGTVESIVVKTVEKMRENFGTAARDLICAIGPAATCRNYEVGADVIEAFSEKFPASKNLFAETKPGHALIDLHRANREQLLNVGTSEENIFTAPLCTMERTDLFFSYRKEKNLYGKTGRLLSVIGRIQEKE
jgi:YfiH family protein